MIKKVKLVSLLFFMTFILSACNKKDKSVAKTVMNNINEVEAQKKTSTGIVDRTKAPDNKVEEYKIEDFYPAKENMTYIYEGVGSPYASQKSYLEFKSNNRFQMKYINDGTILSKVLENTGSELKEIFYEGDCFHVENVLSNVKESDSNILLATPLKEGTSWTVANGRQRTITSMNMFLKTPYKNFKAIEVTTFLEDGIIQKDYYAKGVGFVGSIYRDGDFEVKSLLNSIEKGPYKADIKGYYQSRKDGNIVRVNSKLNYNTNDKIENMFEELFKHPYDEMLIPLISEDVKINNIKVDKKNSIISIDFNSNFIKHMDMKSIDKENNLKAIVNTLGEFYGIKNISITVDSNKYEIDQFKLNNNIKK